MNNRYNLIDEPCIPITDAGFVNLMSIFKNYHLKALGGNPVEKIANMKLLLAITQAACTPQNKPEWVALGPEGLAEKCIVYLEKWYDRFYLYGDNPFLQLPSVASAEKKSYSTFIPTVATGNTTSLTEYNIEKSLDNRQKTQLLTTQMSMALGGKKVDNSLVLSPNYTEKTNPKGKPTTGKPGPAVGHMGMLHSFITGNTLLETLWLNLFTKENIEELNLFEHGIGQAPWEAMPEGEDCPKAKALKGSLMGRLVPMNRFCLLADDGIHVTEGIQHLNYKEGLFDPSITINQTLKQPKVIWTDPGKRPWRDLVALLGFLNDTKNYDCFQLKYTIPRAIKNKIPYGLWSGGFRVSSNAGEQYASGKDDYVESHFSIPLSDLHTKWFKDFEGFMSDLDDKAKKLYGCVSSYFKKQKVEGKEQAARATRLFWELCERHAQEIINCDDDHEKTVALKRLCNGYLLQIYDQICPNTTAKQMAIWAQCRPFSEKASHLVKESR